MYCKFCGNKTSDEAAFCEKCGKPTKEKDVIGSTCTSIPMILNIITIIVLVFYILLICMNWYSVEINLGYGIGGNYSVGLLSAFECSEEITQIVDDWGDYLSDDVKPVLTVLQYAPVVLFLLAAVELVIAVTNIVVTISKIKNKKDIFYPCAWHWLDGAPIAAVAIGIVFKQNLNTDITYMFDFSVSASIYIMLILCLGAEFVLNTAGGKYSQKRIGSWVNDIADAASVDSPTKELLTKSITFKQTNNDQCGKDQWECTSCGRRFSMEVLKCNVCNLMKDDCIRQMERERRKK